MEWEHIPENKEQPGEERVVEIGTATTPVSAQSSSREESIALTCEALRRKSSAIGLSAKGRTGRVDPAVGRSEYRVTSDSSDVSRDASGSDPSSFAGGLRQFLRRTDRMVLLPGGHQVLSLSEFDYARDFDEELRCQKTLMTSLSDCVAACDAEIEKSDKNTRVVKNAVREEASACAADIGWRYKKS